MLGGGSEGEPSLTPCPKRGLGVHPTMGDWLVVPVRLEMGTEEGPPATAHPHRRHPSPTVLSAGSLQSPPRSLQPTTCGPMDLKSL